MIARYSQIQQQVDSLSSLLEKPGHVQKIFSTSRYLCMQVRLPGRNICVFLGRGGGYEGVWIGKEVPISFLRLRDRWLEWCRKNFTSSLLLDAIMDPEDRGVVFYFQKGGERQDLHLAWIGRHCYFALYDHASCSWFTSWKGRVEDKPGFEIFQEVGRREAREGTPSKTLTSIEELLKEEEKQARHGAVPKQKIRSQKTKIERIKGDLQKISQWNSFKEYLEVLDPSELETKDRISHHDLSYKFPRGLSIWQRRDWLFNQVKRLKGAEILQKQRLEKSLLELNKMELGSEVEENPLRPNGPIWKNLVQPTGPSVQRMEEYQVHAFENYKIGVGATAHGNDQLRKSWGKNDDWWVHAANGTSSHGIIKLATPGIPSPLQLSMAAKLIAKQSGIAATQLEIITTQVKNVRGVTGKAGMVTYKKPKKLLCELSDGDSP